MFISIILTQTHVRKEILAQTNYRHVWNYCTKFKKIQLKKTQKPKITQLKRSNSERFHKPVLTLSPVI